MLETRYITETIETSENDRDNYVLRVENITKIYNKGKKNEVQALKGVSFGIKKGEFISIMGPSGSGKSTILNILGALDTPTSGEVYINKQPLSRLSGSKLNYFRRKEIGLIFQSYNLIPVLNAIENVSLSLILNGIRRAERNRRAKELLEIVGLGDRLNHKINELSGGQLQRIAIARSLANEPSIILADEPTGNLDTKTGDDIIRLFKDLNKNHNQTFIIVTHNPAVAERCDKTLLISDGYLKEITINQHIKRTE